MKWCIPLLLLIACGAQPAPLMQGAQRWDGAVAGRSYTVFWTAHLVEVIRIGWAVDGEHQAIRATMIDLATRITGCRLNARSLTGDSGEMHGRITCPSAA